MRNQAECKLVLALRVERCGVMFEWTRVPCFECGEEPSCVMANVSCPAPAFFEVSSHDGTDSQCEREACEQEQDTTATSSHVSGPVAIWSPNFGAKRATPVQRLAREAPDRLLRFAVQPSRCNRGQTSSTWRPPNSNSLTLPRTHWKPKRSWNFRPRWF